MIRLSHKRKRCLCFGLADTVYPPSSAWVGACFRPDGDASGKHAAL